MDIFGFCTREVYFVYFYLVFEISYLPKSITLFPQVSLDDATAYIHSALEVAKKASVKLSAIQNEMAHLLAVYMQLPDTKKGRRKMEKAFLRAQKEAQELNKCLHETLDDLKTSEKISEDLKKKLETKTSEVSKLKKEVEYIKRLTKGKESLQKELDSTKEILPKAIAKNNALKTINGAILAPQPAPFDHDSLKQLEINITILREEIDKLKCSNGQLNEELAKEKKKHQSELEKIKNNDEIEVIENFQKQKILFDVDMDFETLDDEAVLIPQKDIVKAECSPFSNITTQSEPQMFDLQYLAKSFTESLQLIARDQSILPASDSQIGDARFQKDDTVHPEFPKIVPNHPGHHSPILRDSQSICTAQNQGISFLTICHMETYVKEQIEKINKERNEKVQKLKEELQEMKCRNKRIAIASEAQILELQHRQEREVHEVKVCLKQKEKELNKSTKMLAKVENSLKIAEKERSILKGQLSQAHLHLSDAKKAINEIQEIIKSQEVSFSLESSQVALRGKLNALASQSVQWSTPGTSQNSLVGFGGEGSSVMVTTKKMDGSLLTYSEGFSTASDELTIPFGEGALESKLSTTSQTQKSWSSKTQISWLDPQLFLPNSEDSPPTDQDVSASNQLSGKLSTWKSAMVFDEGYSSKGDRVIRLGVHARDSPQRRVSDNIHLGSSSLPIPPLSSEHLIVQDWFRAYNTVLQLKDHLADVIDKHISKDLVSTLKECNVSADQDQWGESIDDTMEVKISNIRCQLNLLLLQMEQIFQLYLMQVHTASAKTALPEQNTIFKDNTLLKEAHWELKSQMHSKKKDFKITADNSRGNIVPLELNLTGIQKETSALRQKVNKQKGHTEVNQQSIMFTQRDHEHNEKGIQRAVDLGRLSRDDGESVIEHMSEYIGLQSRRFSLLVKQIQRKSIQASVISSLQITAKSGDKNNVKEKVEKLLQKFQSNWLSKMDTFSVQRETLAHSLTAELAKIEMAAGIFMIKPIILKPPAFKPSYYIPISRPLSRSGSMITTHCGHIKQDESRSKVRDIQVSRKQDNCLPKLKVVKKNVLKPIPGRDLFLKAVNIMKGHHPSTINIKENHSVPEWNVTSSLSQNCKVDLPSVFPRIVELHSTTKRKFLSTPNVTPL